MMSAAMPVASAAPTCVQRNTRIHAVATSRTASLGGKWANGGASSKALKARARVVAPRHVIATPVRAKSLEERIADGEFTQSQESPLLWGLNNLRDAVKNVSPQSTCLILSRRVSDELFLGGFGFSHASHTQAVVHMCCLILHNTIHLTCPKP